MKLLWLTVAPLDTPGFRVTQFGMAIALERLGWEISLISKTNSTKPFDGFPGFKGRVILIPRKGKILTELNYHRILWKILLKESFDVVIFEPPQLRLVLLPTLFSLLKIIKPFFVLDVRTPLVEDAVHSYLERFNYWLTMQFARWFLPGVTVITKALKNDLQHFFGKKKPVAIWESGVDAAVFDPDRVTAISLNNDKLKNRFVLFNHGSLTFNKGLQELIVSMKRLKSNYPEVALVFMGDGVAKETFKKQVQGLQLEDTVYFLDTISNADVPGYIAMADIGVNPLPNERCWQVSSPLKLFEYMSMRKPLVLSDIEAHRSVLGESSFVVYAKEVNPEGIYNALKLAIERISDLKKNAYHAREEVINNHTWIKKAEILSDFLFCLMNRKNVKNN
ncbi:MAG: hypothetical protein HW406_59 [Candidatus Brocadiaceae bacterium]|nr:hypothetical protein [Candidatus Brocadiaceae bacterium]